MVIAAPPSNLTVAILPSGGKTIGDGGDVAARLDFIPNLIGKTFLDIGSEEGYAVFNALEKKAKFAKGLNINLILLILLVI